MPLENVKFGISMKIHLYIEQIAVVGDFYIKNDLLGRFGLKMLHPLKKFNLNSHSDVNLEFHTNVLP